MPPSQHPRCTLLLGDEGEQVKQLQLLLGAPVDGYFGVETQTYLLKFQGFLAIPADGVYGSLTWKKIDMLTGQNLEGWEWSELVTPEFWEFCFKNISLL